MSEGSQKCQWLPLVGCLTSDQSQHVSKQVDALVDEEAATLLNRLQSKTSETQKRPVGKPQEELVEPGDLASNAKERQAYAKSLLKFYGKFEGEHPDRKSTTKCTRSTRKGECGDLDGCQYIKDAKTCGYDDEANYVRDQMDLAIFYQEQGLLDQERTELIKKAWNATGDQQRDATSEAEFASEEQSVSRPTKAGSKKPAARRPKGRQQEEKRTISQDSAETRTKGEAVAMREKFLDHRQHEKAIAYLEGMEPLPTKAGSKKPARRPKGRQQEEKRTVSQDSAETRTKGEAVAMREKFLDHRQHEKAIAYLEGMELNKFEHK